MCKVCPCPLACSLADRSGRITRAYLEALIERKGGLGFRTCLTQCAAQVAPPHDLHFVRLSAWSRPIRLRWDLRSEARAGRHLHTVLAELPKPPVLLTVKSSKRQCANDNMAMVINLKEDVLDRLCSARLISTTLVLSMSDAQLFMFRLPSITHDP